MDFAMAIEVNQGVVGDTAKLIMHRLIARQIRRDPALVEKAKIAHARQADQFAGWPFVREWDELLSLPPDELTSKLISRDREMVRLRNSSPFYLCEGVDIGDYKMRIRIRRAASPDVRPLPRSADASPFSVVDRAAALRPLAGIVRADHDRRLLAGRSGRLPGEGPTDCRQLRDRHGHPTRPDREAAAFGAAVS